MRFPLSGRARDFHPLEYAHVGRTEKTRVEEEHIYLDPRISFQEIDRYFLSGCACAFFQVATDVYTDLRYNQEEWE